MADFPTFQELFRIARDETLSRSRRLTKEIVETKGSDANALTASGAAVGDAVVGQLVSVSAALFLDTARKSDLDRLVYDRYQILRNPAAPAVGEVELTTTAASTGFTIPINTPLQTIDGKAFKTTEQVIFPVGSTGPVSVPVQSTQSGLNQQAAAGTITTITFSGKPADLVCTNALATAGADDEETDEALRARAKLHYTTAQRGTLSAIERAALAVPGVRTALAYESVEADATPARLVELVISDALVEQLVDATVIPGGYQAQADALSLLVKSALLETRAAGINVVVTLATVKMVGITMLLRYRSGVNVAATTEAARAVAVAYTNGLRAGESFVPEDLENLLTTVPGLNVLGGEVVSPSDEETATTLQVLRTTSSQVVIGSA